MFFGGFKWFWEVLEGFRRVWEGLGWVGRGGEGWGEVWRGGEGWAGVVVIVIHSFLPCLLSVSTDSEIAI